jgi:signal transduction histidine kinase
MTSPEYGEEDRMTTVPAKPAAPAAEEERHRLTVLEEADRGRAALLATVSHDLRAPLAAAKAAVSGLRAGDARLTAYDRADLLAAAEESLDQLAHLAASLLDVSRLPAAADRPDLREPGRAVRGRSRAGHPGGRPDAVFQPFCRPGAPGDSTGVGLGLPVARGLAETMAGTVEPEDTPGGGLTMVLILPAAPPGPPPIPGAPARYGLRDEAAGANISVVPHAAGSRTFPLPRPFASGIAATNAVTAILTFTAASQ